MWHLTLNMSTPLMQTNVGNIVCKFRRNPAICPREEAIFVTSQKCPYHVTFDLDLDLEHTLDAGRAGNNCVQVWWRSSTLTLSTLWMQSRLGTIVCKFGGDPAICPREEAIFVTSQKCPYHVTFDLDLDLEHTPDVGPSGDHRVQAWWRSSHLSGRRSDLRKMFTERQTDGRTEGRRIIHSFILFLCVCVCCVVFSFVFIHLLPSFYSCVCAFYLFIVHLFSCRSCKFASVLF